MEDGECSSKGKAGLYKSWGHSEHGGVTVPDQFAPPTFSGKPSEDPEKWASYFDRFIMCQGWSEEQALQFFPLCLRGKAFDWYENQTEEAKHKFDLLRETFTTYFVPSALDRMLEAENVFNRVQQSEESVRDYVQTMVTLSKRLANVDPGTLRCLVIKGFRPHVKGYVLQHQEQCHTLDDVVKVARVAEATAAESTKEMSTLTRQMEENFKVLSAKLDSISRARADQPAQSVRFQETERDRRSPSPHRFYSGSQNRNRQSPTRTDSFPRSENARSQPQQSRQCTRCGRTNCRGGDRCIAMGKVCRRCNRPNHFQSMCRSTPRSQ
jgi:hypothetical protein